MADDDEVDVMGEFSFNSCLAQNNQGIPSCSDREDTVHPQWLLDSTATNWYDIQNKESQRMKGISARMLPGGNASTFHIRNTQTNWTKKERQQLVKEMEKYGRDTRKLAQMIKTKTAIEIQALIDAEFGVQLDDALTVGIDKAQEDRDDAPAVVQEEIVTDDSHINSIINMVTTGSTTISLPKKPFRHKNIITKAKNSLLKPDVLINIKQTENIINQSEIFYDDDLIIGSTESVGTQAVDSVDKVSQKLLKLQKSDAKAKPTKKIGNHRRKNSRSSDKGSPKPRNQSKDIILSPLGRQRNDSSVSEESTKSPKMQIVLGSGKSLPVSECEQVIKIEKKKESDESDIEIDIDSDTDNGSPRKLPTKESLGIVTLPDKQPVLRNDDLFTTARRKFEPMPRRQKKINLDGGGGYTIMHTESGDLYEISSEPRRERVPKKQPVNLIQCRVYNAERPAPYEVRLCVSALIAMDVQAHSSTCEVMGLLGGGLRDGALTFRAYRPAAAAATATHCDMDPVSQALAADSLRAAGHELIGWHHSHPTFPPAPSHTDLMTQGALQAALERAAPFVAFVTSQHWPTGRRASQYRCFRVEASADGALVGFQFSVKLVADLTPASLPAHLSELRTVLRHETRSEFTVNMDADRCPQAGVTYLDKCISSISHHLRSAGYAQDDPVASQLILGVRDIFR